MITIPDKTEKYLASIDRSLKVIAKALSDNEPPVTKDTPFKRKPPDVDKLAHEIYHK